MLDSKPTVPGESPFTEHHWYLGLALMCLGFVYLFYCPWFLWLPWVILGSLVAVDDLYKHHRRKTVPNYLSPYNKLIAYIYTRWQPKGKRNGLYESLD